MYKGESRSRSRSRDKERSRGRRRGRSRERPRVTLNDNPHGRPDRATDGATSTESYICLVIYTHGTVLQSDIYTEHTKSCYDEITKKPAFVNNDALHYADVDYVGLITHPPLGCYDWSSNISKMIGLRNYLFKSERINGLNGEKLRDEIKAIDRESFFSMGSNIRQNTIEKKAHILQPDVLDTEQTAHNILLSKILISNNPDSVYALGEYDRTNGENTILNKRYTIENGSSEEKIQNIFVVAQKGGILKNGEHILRSEKFNRYKNTLMGIALSDPSHPISSHPMFSVDDDFIRTGRQRTEINTISLIYYLRDCGYRNINLIDYSCNRCIGANADKVRGTRSQLKGGKTKKKRNKKKK
jgi:hypothetical protein